MTYCIPMPTTQTLANQLRSSSDAFFSGEITGAEQRRIAFAVWDKAQSTGLTEALRAELLRRERG